MMNTKDLLQKTGMLAVLALALASCSEDELINRKGAASNAISFGIASPTHSADSLPSRSPQARETGYALSSRFDNGQHCHSSGPRARNTGHTGG